jgi:hypothetical protein
MTVVKLKFPLASNAFVAIRGQLLNGTSTLVEART